MHKDTIKTIWKPYCHTFEAKVWRQIEDQTNWNSCKRKVYWACRTSYTWENRKMECNGKFILQRRRVNTYTVNFYCNWCSRTPSELQSCCFAINTIKPLPCWPQTALRIKIFYLTDYRTRGTWAIPFHFTRRHISNSESNYIYWRTRNFHQSKEKGSWIPDYSKKNLSWNKIKTKPCLCSTW